MEMYFELPCFKTAQSNIVYVVKISQKSVWSVQSVHKNTATQL